MALIAIINNKYMNYSDSILNSSSTPFSVNVYTSQDGLPFSLQILLITIPIILTPIIGLCSWFVRGYFDKRTKALEQHKDEKKKYMIEHIGKQIKSFYWPLYLHLIRYRQLVDRYKEFKAGHFSLSTGNSNEDKGSSDKQVAEITKLDHQIMVGDGQKPNINVEMIELVDMNNKDASTDHNFVGSTSMEVTCPLSDKKISQEKISHEKISHEKTSHEKTPQENISNSSSEKDIIPDAQLFPTLFSETKKNSGIGLKNAIKIINKFNQAINQYENKMMSTLKSIQKIYTQYAPIAEPDIELLKELTKLDEYITYMTTFKSLSDKNSADGVLEEKMDKAKFPKNVPIMIEDQLHYLQSVYNDLVYNHNTVVLDTDYKPVHNYNRNEYDRKYRLSSFRTLEHKKKLHVPELSAHDTELKKFVE